jgi:hypothetical protein
MQRDPRISLEALAQKGAPDVVSRVSGTAVQADASAVLKDIDFAKLTAAVRDYDRYKQMGMPYVVDSRVVSRVGTDVVTIWTHMRMSVFGLTQTSKHYFEVRLFELAAGASGAEWQQAHPAMAPFPDETAFDRLDGSWFAEPLADGKSAYVRYYLSGTLSNGLAGLFSGKIEGIFRTGVRDVILTLARQAAVRR